MNKTASKASPRRKPRQTRSRITAEAISQAFLQLLMAHGYDNVSIRQVVDVAGVGIGSFYEYFSSKASVAAVCVHLRIKDIARRMAARIETTRTESLPDRVDALITAQIEMPLSEPEQWAAIFSIERLVSSSEAYQRMYAKFVNLWQTCLSEGPDWPTDAHAQTAALTAHAIAYGLVSQSLLATKGTIDTTELHQQMRLAIHGYLSIVAPRAYRLHGLARLSSPC